MHDDQQYSVTVVTVFEASKIPLNKWLMATHLMCASKKARSFVLDTLTVGEVGPILAEDIARDSRLMTDEAHMYGKIAAVTFDAHAKVHRAKASM